MPSLTILKYFANLGSSDTVICLGASAAAAGAAGEPSAASAAGCCSCPPSAGMAVDVAGWASAAADVVGSYEGRIQFCRRETLRSLLTLC